MSEDGRPSGPADREGGRSEPASGAPAGTPERIVLVGFMAAGKTTVGRELGARLGYRFIDLDEEIERRAGRSIPRIFREDGEAEFRRLEAEVTRALDEVVVTRPDGRHGLVVAAGGGWMARPELRDRWPGAVRIWLRVRPETALERLDGSLDSRPMLDADDPLGSIRALLEGREADYARAEHSVETNGLPPDEVVDRILAAIARHG